MGDSDSELSTYDAERDVEQVVEVLPRPALTLTRAAPERACDEEWCQHKRQGSAGQGQAAIDVECLVVQVTAQDLEAAGCAQEADQLDDCLVRHGGAAAVHDVNCIVRAEELPSFCRDERCVALERRVTREVLGQAFSKSLRRSGVLEEVLGVWSHGPSCACVACAA
jgi:hypothetical protein